MGETPHRIRQEDQGGRAIFYLEGEFDIYSSPDLKERLLEAIDGGCNEIIIDLTKVVYVDSTFLGVVVRAVKKTRGRRGKVGLVISDENIRRVFDITGLDRILLTYETNQEAQNGFDRGDKPIHT